MGPMKTDLKAGNGQLAGCGTDMGRKRVARATCTPNCIARFLFAQCHTKVTSQGISFKGVSPLIEYKETRIVSHDHSIANVFWEQVSDVLSP